MLLSKYAVRNSKKSKLLKEQEAKALWDTFKHTPNRMLFWNGSNLTGPVFMM